MSKLHIEIYGQGKPIVLIHGWAMHSGIWRDFARKLAGKYQVVSVDLPGHGLSPKVDSFTLQDVCVELAKEFSGQALHWLGWSLGGLVMLEMAQRFPLLVSSMTLLASNPKFMEDKNWPGISEPVLDQFAENLTGNAEMTLQRFLALQVKNAPDFKMLLSGLKKALAETPTPDVDVLLGGLAILKKSDMRLLMECQDIPLQIILGEKDTLVPVEVSIEIQAINPKLQVSVIKGAGHAPFLSHQQVLLDKVTEFIQ